MQAPFNPILRTLSLASRWGMAPFFFGLIAVLAGVALQFARELWQIAIAFPDMGNTEVILAALRLIELVLMANLIVLILGAGVEAFTPQEASSEGARPKWSGMVDLHGLKLRVFGSISAIVAIDLLESFVKIESIDRSGLLWEVLVLLAFAVSGVLLGWMDRLSADRD